jgi:hypothetical protein
MSAFESNITDADILRAFANTNFGGVDHRELLEKSVLKKTVGYYCGHTITTIMGDLGLIGKGGKITKKGQTFLQHALHEFLLAGG